MEKKDGYERGFTNAGAQEVPALRKSAGAVKKATATRGKDLRSGK